jgi:sensor histidine kinase YesM
LQAQMEPHFLFNTLANVQSLIDHEPGKAKQMLDSFTTYLRASLGQLRASDSTLDAELALSETYLNLLQMRMEDRLHFHIEADATARAAQLPPLTLQPLVENAIHHGLEPKLEGGTVRVNARVQGERLLIEVRDDGLGLNAPPRRSARSAAGAGMALANLRQRLSARFGSDASVSLSDNQPGACVQLSLPYQPSTP